MRIAVAIAALGLAACGSGKAPEPATATTPHGWWCYAFRSPAVVAGVCVRERDACEHAPQRDGDCKPRDVASCYRTRHGDDCAPTMDECTFRQGQTSASDGNAVVLSPCAELR